MRRTTTPIATAVLIACCCSARMDARLVTAEELRTAAESACRSQFAGDGAVDIVFIGRQHDRDVPGSQVTLVARPLPGERSAGPVTVTLDIVADGKTAAVVRVPLRVTLTRRVPVAARDIARGEIITHADITLRTVTLTAVPRTLIREATAAVGQRARCRIPRASMLYEGMVEQPPAVTNRQMLTVVSEAGRCRVSFRARAGQDGWVGDRIKILNPVNNRAIWAVVTSTAIARVPGGSP